MLQPLAILDSRVGTQRQLTAPPYEVDDIAGTETIKEARASRAPPFVVAMNAVASVLAVSVSVVCDQVDQVVPAHQVDDINEVHELDPVHQVDHKDEYTSPQITSHHVTYHIKS